MRRKSPPETRPRRPCPARTQAAPGRSRATRYALGAVVLIATIAGLVLFLRNGTSQPVDGTLARATTTAPVSGPDNGPQPAPPSPPLTTAPVTTSPVTAPPITVPPTPLGRGGEIGRGGRAAVTTAPPIGGDRGGRAGTVPPTVPATTVAPTTVPPTTVPVTTVATTAPATTVAPTTVPPTTVAATTIPAQAPQVADRPLIEQTLRAYAAAYERLDVEGVLRLHPTQDRRALTNGFKELKSQTVDIDPKEITINGTDATVTASVRTRVVLADVRVRPPQGRPP